MDFGMFTDFHIRKGMTQADAFEESFNQVEAAERLGIDSVWLAEHHFSPDRSVLASPLVIASSIATRTSRIRIGLAVQVLPLTNPLRVAEESALVVVISVLVDPPENIEHDTDTELSCGALRTGGCPSTQPGGRHLRVGSERASPEVQSFHTPHRLYFLSCLLLDLELVRS